MSDTQLEAAQAHLAGIQLQLLDEILPAAAFLRQLEEFRTSVSPFSCLQISGSPHHQLLPTIIPNPLGFWLCWFFGFSVWAALLLVTFVKKKKSYNGNTQNTQNTISELQLWDGIVRNRMHIAAHLTCFAGSLSRQPLIQGILPLYTDTCTLTHTKKPGLSHRWAVQSIPVWFY